MLRTLSEHNLLSVWGWLFRAKTNARFIDRACISPPRLTDTSASKSGILKESTFSEVNWSGVNGEYVSTCNTKAKSQIGIADRRGGHNCLAPRRNVTTWLFLPTDWPNQTWNETDRLNCHLHGSQDKIGSAAELFKDLWTRWAVLEGQAHPGMNHKSKDNSHLGDLITHLWEEWGKTSKAGSVMAARLEKPLIELLDHLEDDTEEFTINVVWGHHCGGKRSPAHG